MCCFCDEKKKKQCNICLFLVGRIPVDAPKFITHLQIFANQLQGKTNLGGAKAKCIDAVFTILTF
jgi:hypothetical protein